MISAPKICGRSHIRAGLSGYVAELGAAFLCGDLGISAEPRPDHAAYIDNWLRILKSDRKAMFTAASAANKAAEFLANLSKIERKEAA
jgi:antirestriction protein ArdC